MTVWSFWSGQREPPESPELTCLSLLQRTGATKGCEPFGGRFERGLLLASQKLASTRCGSKAAPHRTKKTRGPGGGPGRTSSSPKGGGRPPPCLSRPVPRHVRPRSPSSWVGTGSDPVGLRNGTGGAEGIRKEGRTPKAGLGASTVTFGGRTSIVLPLKFTANSRCFFFLQGVKTKEQTRHAHPSTYRLVRFGVFLRTQKQKQHSSLLGHHYCRGHAY